MKRIVWVSLLGSCALMGVALAERMSVQVQDGQVRSTP